LQAEHQQHWELMISTPIVIVIIMAYFTMASFQGKSLVWQAQVQIGILLTS
jgi:hypothetical protein